MVQRIALNAVVKSLGDRLRKVFGRKPDGKVQGRVSGADAGSIVSGRSFFNRELPEIPIRQPERAEQLIQIRYFSRHGGEALQTGISDCFSSTDGDDMGWTYAPTLDDNVTPVDPEILDHLLKFKQRQFQDDYVIGGTFCQAALTDAVSYGDGFWQLAIGMVDGHMGITRIENMPCWEMFRCNDDTGALSHYEQRFGWGQKTIKFDPVQIVQLSRNRCGKYGQSIYELSQESWADVKDAIADESEGSRNSAINPIVHEDPEGFSAEQKERYKAEIAEKQANGILTNLFPNYGQKIYRLSGGNTSIKELMDRRINLEKHLIPPGFPIWLFAEFEGNGARDLSGQPALSYMRLINGWRAIAAKAIKQATDIELVLRFGEDVFKQRGAYRVVFPEWKLNLAAEDDESNTAGIQDLNLNSTPVYSGAMYSDTPMELSARQAIEWANELTKKKAT